MQYFVQWHVNFDGLCLGGGRCLVIFCWFSPFLHFSLAHSRPLRVDPKHVHKYAEDQQCKSHPHPCPHAMDDERLMSLIFQPCADRLIELDSTTCVQGDESLKQRLWDLPPLVEPLSSQQILSVQTTITFLFWVTVYKYRLTTVGEWKSATSQHSPSTLKSSLQKLHYWRGSEWTIALNTLRRCY